MKNKMIQVAILLFGCCGLMQAKLLDELKSAKSGLSAGVAGIDAGVAQLQASHKQLSGQLIAQLQTQIDTLNNGMVADLKKLTNERRDGMLDTIPPTVKTMACISDLEEIVQFIGSGPLQIINETLQTTLNKFKPLINGLDPQDPQGKALYDKFAQAKVKFTSVVAKLNEFIAALEAPVEDL